LKHTFLEKLHEKNNKSDLIPKKSTGNHFGHWSLLAPIDPFISETIRATA